jgi:hypothetical protein
MTEKLTPQQVLDLALPDNDSGKDTVRGYLIALLAGVWRDGECFDGKRPFGNSSWEYDLYGPLVRAGMVTGTFDRDGDLVDLDDDAANALIADAIQSLGAPTIF